MTEKKLIKKMKKAGFVFKHSHPAGGLTFGYDASGFSFEVSVCPAAEADDKCIVYIDLMRQILTDAGWIRLAVARNLVYWNEEAAEKTKDAIERLGSVLSRLKKD